MNGKIRTTLLSAAGAMLSAVVIRRSIFGAFDRHMVGTALDREEPKAMQKLKERLKGEAVEDEEVMVLCRQMQQRLEQSPHETVRITGYDGTPLVGHLFRAEGEKRVILAMHGWRSCWARDFGPVADFFRENDCTVLYAQQRGQGESGGDYMGFGMIERFDCLEWIKWLNDNGFGGRKIYLAGISMGATTVLMAAGEPLPESVKGIQADCGFTSPKAIWKHVTEQNLHMSVGPLRQVCTDLAFRRKLRQGLSAYSTRTAMEQNTIPVLFVHGTEDRFVPIQMTYDNYLSCAAPRYLVVVPGATHAMSYAVEPETCQKAMLSFWQMYDGNTTEAPS